MVDDAKLTLGIDMEALQRSASQATSMLSKAFAGVGPSSLLGSGVAPSQGTSPQQGAKDTLRGVIDALERVDRTLVIGFNSLAGGVYLSGRAGGVSGSGNGSPSLPPEPPKELPSRRRPGSFGGGAISAAGDLASALMPSTLNMIMGGFYGTDIMGFLHNAVSQIPIAGRLLGAVTAPLHQAMQKEDEYKNTKYEMFRDVGKGGMDAFNTLWEDDDYRKNYTKRYGFSRSETQQLTHLGYRNGLGLGGESQGLNTVLDMQGQLGLGQEAAGTMGSLKRGGVKDNDMVDAMAGAIGTAVSTGLERGRWGEMLTLWQRSAQSSIDTDFSLKELLMQQKFIGSLGERYKGDTAANQSMGSSLNDMTSNEKSGLAWMGALALSKGNVAVATARMKRSREKPDYELAEWVINRLSKFDSSKRYMNAPESTDAEKARAGVLLDEATLVVDQAQTGVPFLKLEELLKAKKAAGGGPVFKLPTAAELEEGKRQVTGQGKLPEDTLGPRRAESEKQRPTNVTGFFQRIGRWFSNPLGNTEPNNDELLTPGQEIKNIEGLGQPPLSTSASSPIITPITTPNNQGATSSPSDYRQFVMQDFGNRIPGRSAPHPGVDLAFPPGTAVTCPVDGVVTEIHPNGTGLQIGTGIHIRDDSGEVWKLYHLDPETVPQGIQIGQRIIKGTFLGRTYSVRNWVGSGVRTHLHVGQIGPSGRLLNPMRPGGIEPGSLTGGSETTPVVGQSAGASTGSGSTQSRGNQVQAQRVEADVHVYVHQDALGRPVVRTRGSNSAVSGPPATPSLDFDRLMR